MCKAHNKEVEKIELEDKLRRALDEKFPTARERPTEVSLEI